MSIKTSKFQNLLDWRRLGHWETSAAKARLSAFALWTLSKTKIRDLADMCGHQSDDGGFAFIEAFKRESAISIELILKAVIVRKIQSKQPAEHIPKTHDIPKLWKLAGLADLSKDDQYRLQMAKSILMWSGRYSTPNTAEAWEKEDQEFEALLEQPAKGERFIARIPIVINWEDFDRLYQIAATALKHP